jgi:hypothetical protein
MRVMQMQSDRRSKLASVPSSDVAHGTFARRQLEIRKPEIGSEAFYGPIGEWVNLITPHTEANAPALLFSALVGVGALIGRTPSATLDGARHGVNLFAILVGATSSGRKGTAVARVRRLLRDLDPEFAMRNTGSGLSSGQGIIYHVRDPKSSPNGKKVVDAGIQDKRLFVIEAEFAGALRQMRGRENTLSAVIREAWDGYSLRTLTKGDPLTATDPHIGILAQITPEELRRQFEAIELHNGFLNRFLIVLTDRSRLLPFGSEPDPVDSQRAIDRLRAAVYTARQRTSVEDFTDLAREWWAAEYPRLTTGTAGRSGAATQRAAAQVRRIALLFAVLDGRRELDVHHLEAANAVWEYARASADFVFGGSDLSARARRVESALLAAGPSGMDRTSIREDALGSHNIPAQEIDAVLSELHDVGLARETDLTTSGRPRQVWIHEQFVRNGQ